MRNQHAPIGAPSHVAVAAVARATPTVDVGARRLYDRVGFVLVERENGSLTMRLDLGSDSG